MAHGQETNSHEEIFSIFYNYWYVECTHYNRLNKAILMCTHSIKFHDKI